MDRLRVAVTGLKGVGRQHVREIAAHDRAELSAVCDLDRPLAEAAGQEHGASVWTRFDEMLLGCDLDAVVIATPHYLHAPMGLASLESGRHTFVEKPIANTVSEADKLIAAADERGLKLAVGHNYRTFPGNRALKGLLDSGAIGQVHRVLWQWLETRSEAYYDRDEWRCTWEHAGGGVLMNQTSHDLDLLCWMMGDPAEVSGMVGNWAHRAEVEDTAVASIRFSSGALCNVQFSVCDRRLNHRQISGDCGTIVYSDTKNANSSVPDELLLGRYAAPMRGFIAGSGGPIAGQPEVRWETVPVDPAPGQTLMASFLDAILGGGEPITDGLTSRRTLELINAILLSAVRKETVTLPLDRERYDRFNAELSAGDARISRQPR